VTEQYDQPAYRDMFGTLAGEVMAVAHACGITVEQIDGFDPNVFAFDAPADPLGVQATWEGQHRYWNRHEGGRTGVWRDLAQHRRKTEVDQQVGVVVDLAATHGVAVPRLQALLRIVHAVETGARPLGYANLEALVAISREAARH
jgi:2-dehydropantoate 2-reductase